jgi:hypothetical protein
MDPTIIAALAGVLGVILGAVIGGVFALKATKRQIEVMMISARGDVNERLYNQSLQILRFFAENPSLRPYFADNRDLSTCENELEKCRVLSTVEMVAGFMELVSLQLAEQPLEIQPRWKAYVVDAYNSSVVMREHVASYSAWYADDFLRLLPTKPVEPSTHETLDESHA